jgi:uncharacterized delta-60 repeat protein
MKKIVLLIISMLSISVTAQNAGDLDTTYGISGKTAINFGQASFIIENQAIQSDGKIVLAGRMYNDSNSFGFILRLNADGTIDTSFNTTGKVYNTFISGFTKVIIQPDGKILVLGEQRGEVALARYTASGTLDTTFDVDGMNYATSFVSNYVFYDAAIQSDGKILTVSRFFTTPSTNYRIRRFNSNGSIDTTFGVNGTLFYDLGSDEYPAAIEVLSDDKFYVGGTSSGTVKNVFVSKHNSNGTLDTSFNTTGVKLVSFSGSTSSSMSDLVVQPDGKIVTSNQAYVSGVARIIMVRYNTNGNLDTTFDTDGAAVTIMSSNFAGGSDNAELKLQPDGKIVVMETLQPIINDNSNHEVFFARYNSNGTLDTSFDSDGQLNYSYFSLNDNATDFDIVGTKIIVSGNTEEDYTTNKIAIARLNSNGTFDNSFDADGKLFYTFPFAGYDVATCSKLQSDGKLVVGSVSYLNETRFTVSRYNVDGTLDLSFGINGVTVINRYAQGELKSIDFDSNGKIVVAGGTTNFDVFRLNSNGILDSTFGTNGFATSPGVFAGASAVKVLSTGKILIAGSVASTINSIFSGNYLLARLNSNGTNDTTFGTNGFTSVGSTDSQEELVDLEVQSDGKILTLGFIPNGSDVDSVVFRYNSNGTLDTTFNGNGIATFGGAGGDYPTNMELQNDGKIIIGANADSTLSPVLVRLTTSGSFDTTFDGDGMLYVDPLNLEFMNDFKLMNDGSIILTGVPSFTNSSDFIILKYNSNAALDTSFGTQGRVSTDFFGSYDSPAKINITSDNKAIIAGLTYNNTNFSDDIALAKYFLESVLSNNEYTQGKTPTFYPNPASDYINLNPDVTSFAIYTLEGKFIETSIQNQSIDVSKLSSGVYITQSIMNDDRVINEKIVIN